MLTFSENYGNLASVLGLAITLIGFPLTLWRAVTVRREVEKIRAEYHENVTKSTSSRLADLPEEALWSLRAFSDAAQRSEWPRAVEKMYESRRRVMRPAQSDLLREQHRVTLADQLILMQQLLTHVESYKMRARSPGQGLSSDRSRILAGSETNSNRSYLLSENAPWGEPR